jgi:hypothetical protein
VPPRKILSAQKYNNLKTVNPNKFEFQLENLHNLHDRHNLRVGYLFIYLYSSYHRPDFVELKIFQVISLHLWRRSFQKRTLRGPNSVAYYSFMRQKQWIFLRIDYLVISKENK